MRKKATLFLILILSLVTAGCSGTANTDTTPVPSEATVTGEPENKADNMFSDTVWVGTKKDIMYEYKLEMLDSGDVYLMMLQDDHVTQIEKGSYVFSDDQLKIRGISMIQKVAYDAGTNRIIVTLNNIGLILNFRLLEETVMKASELEDLMNNTGFVIDGWPSDLPVPDFGGEIEQNNLSNGGITLIFRNIDPVKAKEYVEKLKASGFDVRPEQQEAVQEERVDVDGNPIISHIFNAGKGELEYNDLLGYYIPEGYCIHIVYTDKDQYDKDTGKFTTPPTLRIDLSWKDLVFGKD